MKHILRGPMWMLINTTIFSEDAVETTVIVDALISLVNASIDVSTNCLLWLLNFDF